LVLECDKLCRTAGVNHCRWNTRCWSLEEVSDWHRSTINTELRYNKPLCRQFNNSQASDSSVVWYSSLLCHGAATDTFIRVPPAQAVQNQYPSIML